MAAVDLAQYILTRSKELGLNKSELASKSSISRSALYKLLDSDVQEVRISTIVQLANTLQIHPLDLLRCLFTNWDFPVKQSSLAKYPKDATGFIADVTYPDNSLVTAGQTFEKIWEIRNLGGEIWKNRKLVCCDDFITLTSHQTEIASPLPQRGLQPQQREIPIPLTHPNESVRLSVQFLAPPYPVTVISYWKMANAEGELCFPELEGLSCLVKVVAL
ncbi:transcriptional regulator with sigma factor-related N-terminal domain [Beggiatoa alba B18LD]|uniref:Transcriptional regulator with sigma factor-related N-terminal domain n=1 Tax=Beggiatoa alba B18LD TaxID=395493 RepID=I3CI55_9GAMM|nr:NBR1-Ig-like domain-containing protein [Beggiatoa alba]EIJ43298.1 transcriptional regulator with sigma factor-related N-terminal domain [Beggiatoa alba B18LD]